MSKIIKHILANDWITIVIGFLIAINADWVIQLIDPTEAPLSISFYYTCLYGISAYMILNGVSYQMIKLFSPQVYKYFEQDNTELWSQLSPLEVCVISYSVYFLRLFSLIIAVYCVMQASH